VRRGYFVEHLGGSQYALPGAVDRLRASAAAPPPVAGGAAPAPAPARSGGSTASAGLVLLSAVDPASPWGAVVPWPAPGRAEARPARRAGALVLLVDGAPALHVDSGGRRLVTFPEVGDEAMQLAFGAGLRAVARALRRRTLHVESIDGERARGSGQAPLLERAGAKPDYRGFVLEI
jgi:ATP-dependent Lhr-like helicase